MEIVAQQGDITQAKANAIVNTGPFESVPVGEAAFAPVENLPYKGIVHAPTAGTPDQKTTVDTVRHATLAALICADSYGIKTLAMPGIGAGAVSLSAIADAMVETLRNYDTASVRKVILMDQAPEMVTAFRNALFAERS